MKLSMTEKEEIDCRSQNRRRKRKICLVLFFTADDLFSILFACFLLVEDIILDTMGKKLFLAMNFCRRRRKSKIFLFIFSLFIISSSISYWWIEIDSTEQFLYNQIEQSQFDDDPILSKYFTDPYQINIWNIINQSKRNYFNSQHDKYLVYSCRFMCGGK